jgi:hypothetical protein
VSVHLRIQSRSRDSNFIATIPGEGQITPNVESFQRRLPRHERSSLEAPRCQSRDFYAPSIHRVVRASQLEQSRSLAIVRTIHRVCVTTRLRTTRGCRSSLRGLAERVCKAGRVTSVLARAQGRELFSLPGCCYGGGFGTARAESRDARSSQVGPRRWTSVLWVGATPHARIHSSLSFFWRVLQSITETPC